MDILEPLLNLYFSHQIKLKMYHFQTKNFSSHKASDDYLKKFEDNLDKFFEVAQGIFGKFNIKKINMVFSTIDDVTVSEEIDIFIKILKNLDKQFKKYPELLNIRDEIVADAEQLKYLLTFN